VPCYNLECMVQVSLTILAAFRVLFRTRGDTALEILALRQQVAVLERKRPRPPLKAYDCLFWTTLRRIWRGWANVLFIVKPETVVGWHHAGFRHYWRWRSRPRGGRPRIHQEVRDLIGCLAKENPAWGAPKIHAEREKAGGSRLRRLVFHPCGTCQEPE
jgi:hypothetical protein